MTTTLITTNVTTPDRRWTGMARHILCSLPTAAAEREAWLAHVLATAYGARPDMDAVPEAARPYATAAILWHCHEEGYRAAAEQGLSFSDNPYDQVDMHTAWSNGWHTACYHAEQHRRTATLRAHDRWITAFRNGLRAAQEGRNANDCPYQGDEFQAWSLGWAAGRYEQLERLYAAAQRKLAEAEAFAEQINVAFGRSGPRRRC